MEYCGTEEMLVPPPQAVSWGIRSTCLLGTNFGDRIGF